jgi:hypothetical protein
MLKVVVAQLERAYEKTLERLQEDANFESGLHNVVCA